MTATPVQCHNLHAMADPGPVHWVHASLPFLTALNAITLIEVKNTNFTLYSH